MEIEVLPKNSHFILYNKNFLIGKSSKSGDRFDFLHFVRSDIEEAVSIFMQESVNCHLTIAVVNLNIHARRTAKLSGGGLSGIEGRIICIDDNSVTADETIENVTATSEAEVSVNDDVNNHSFEEESRNLKKVCFMPDFSSFEVRRSQFVRRLY